MFIIGAEYRRGRAHYQHKKRSVELFHTAFELFFSIQQLTVQCSVNWNHSLLIIYAYRWFIKFVHVITSVTFFFEFTDRPSQKRSQSSFSAEVPWTVYGYVCEVSIAIVQFANMNFSLQFDSNAADRPFVI